ncbi:MAG TPA: DUF305 domain-containing protein [Mycobacterium sp.]|nr:DUF305 domain-containing protein [Mycobacterium sp.]
MSQPGLHNSDDVAFAHNMLADYQQTIQLSTMALANTTNQQLLTLAQQITAEQQPQVQAFMALLLQWGEDASAAPGGQAGIPGMVDQATVDRLRTLNGSDFDKLWLQSMISHELGAVDMAQAEVTRGQNPDAIALARSIITAQQAEIGQMKQMLGG